MIRLGEVQNLTVVKFRDQGAYLAETEDAGPEERVLLPKAQIPEGTETGDTVSVFIYRDSDDRLIATVNKPYVTLHKLALLTVKQMTKIGAFLDWGLERDLLLPFKEMVGTLTEGDQVLAALYIDRSERLAATMRIYPYLSAESPYIPDAQVKGRVYRIDDGVGIFVAVDDQYYGLIPRQMAYGKYQIGDVLDLRVTHVREDGKLDCSDREKAYLEMDEDAESILAIIREDHDGELPFDDKASPEQIREEFGLSKAAFKRAVGKLYKERRIELTEGKIRVL